MNRLLLVEDDPTSRGFLQAATTALPAEVDTADSLASAHALAAREPHDLWLIDANLPDGTGIELLARLRAEGLQTPAIAHTAAREPEVLAALRAAGFALAVSKPLSAQAWRDAIRQVLDLPATGPAADEAPAADAAPAERPLWNTVAALAAVGGVADNAAALRGLFLGELPATRAAVENAARDGDADALQGALHKLRAGCGFVGADRLCDAAAALHAAPGSAHALDDFLRTLDATLASA
ncbi:response regulator [Luteimonas sp. BDR2-5]|uniref:response regulator n=1 Tax=Proluteimonas luteida TaxID=2878685 RepID=UPI001E317316|nr:response regulator [Luteimonas sp. BDR2-5]MCD9028448.1 response regulator [Luteimonas sp. BDR2-5]